jgi:hypothetical protein
MKRKKDRQNQPHIEKPKNLLHRAGFVKVVPAESLDPSHAS